MRSIRRKGSAAPQSSWSPTVKADKYCGLSWQVLEWNTPAIDFYKKYDATFDGEWVNVMINFG